MYLVFVLVAAPLFFFVMTWTAVTVYRIWFPEEPLPPERDPLIMREVARRAGESMPVGAREIREDQRRHRRVGAGTAYQWVGAPRAQVPEAWAEDVYQRRN